MWIINAVTGTNSYSRGKKYMWIINAVTGTNSNPNFDPNLLLECTLVICMHRRCDVGQSILMPISILTTFGDLPTVMLAPEVYFCGKVMRNHSAKYLSQIFHIPHYSCSNV